MKLTRAHARRIDQLAQQRLGLPGLLLMEHASLNAAAAISDLMHGRFCVAEDATVAIVCGGGNNGGDGYALARHLHLQGLGVRLVALKPVEQLDADAKTNARIAQLLGLPITDRLADADDAQVRVDAVLGTGFEGQLRDEALQVVRWFNGSPADLTVCLDVPTGLDADTGQPCPEAVRADVTITFVGPKVGFDTPAAVDHLGRVVVADIGVPDPLVRDAIELDP
jgi:NAD(P)H-hydrate epimerase